MATEFYFTPELHLKDGRIRRFDRGSTSENEILHKMERAKRKEDAHAAARSFLRWLEELEVLE